MKVTRILSTLALFILSIFSLNVLSADMQSNASSEMRSRSNLENRRDSEIIAWLIVLNKNEIAAAKVVEKRDVNPMVKDYASWLDNQHTQNLNQTMQISQAMGDAPINTRASMTLQRKGQKELAQLQAVKDNKKFEMAYINAMIKGHSDALKALNNDLRQGVNNTQLKNHLVNTRMHVAHHLQQAQMIKRKLLSA